MTEWKSWESCFHCLRVIIQSFFSVDGCFTCWSYERQCVYHMHYCTMNRLWCCFTGLGLVGLGLSILSSCSLADRHSLIIFTAGWASSLASTGQVSFGNLCLVFLTLYCFLKHWNKFAWVNRVLTIRASILVESTSFSGTTIYANVVFSCSFVLEIYLPNLFSLHG